MPATRLPKINTAIFKTPTVSRKKKKKKNNYSTNPVKGNNTNLIKTEKQVQKG